MEFDKLPKSAQAALKDRAHLILDHPAIRARLDGTIVADLYGHILTHLSRAYKIGQGNVEPDGYIVVALSDEKGSILGSVCDDGHQVYRYRSSAYRERNFLRNEKKSRNIEVFGVMWDEEWK